jgi:N-acetylneuraminate lyase
MAKSSPSLTQFNLRGLVAATFTPFRSDGALDVKRIKPSIDAVIAQGADGLYVCGSTGEGPLLTTAERQQVAEASVKAARGRVPVVVQVGHNSIEEARELAAHAQRIGADAVSATPPGYFKPDTLESLIDCTARIAAGAPRLPFYYYHIPALTGVRFDMVAFLRRGGPRIPTLRGIKFSDPSLHELLACLELEGGRYDIVFGVDEMLLGGLAMGARGAVGSTYNFAAPLYHRIMAAFAAGDLTEARRLQALAAEMIRILFANGGRAGFKAAMQLIDADCGHNRLPTLTATAAQRAQLKKELTALGFFTWNRR